MPITREDDLVLGRALDLARNAAAFASPNPTVGCVLTRNHEVIAEGGHLYDNLDHAEIVALKQAGPNAAGATAYVTLEPCSHHGRTGPCADALIAAGITRCVVATLDPNPRVRGKGIARMRHAGIEVLLADPSNFIAQQARQLNDAFAHFIQHRRPFVTLKAAVSVDGQLAPPPAARHTQAPFWLTGPSARANAQLLRHAADALLTGIGTVRADDPLLTDRTDLPRRRPLLRVVLDTNLRIPLRSQLVTTAYDDLLIACAEDAPRDREDALRDRGADIVRLPAREGCIDLPALLEELAGRNLLSLLIEAGSAINGSFLSADLVDQVVLYYAEAELGLDAIPFAAGVSSPYAVQQRLSQATRTTFPNANAEDVRISGYLHDPWLNIP